MGFWRNLWNDTLVAFGIRTRLNYGPPIVPLRLFEPLEVVIEPGFAPDRTPHRPIAGAGGQPNTPISDEFMRNAPVHGSLRPSRTRRRSRASAQVARQRLLEDIMTPPIEQADGREERTPPPLYTPRSRPPRYSDPPPYSWRRSQSFPPPGHLRLRIPSPSYDTASPPRTEQANPRARGDDSDAGPTASEGFGSRVSNGMNYQGML